MQTTPRTTTGGFGEAGEDFSTQARQATRAEMDELRLKVESLMADRITPAVTEVAGRAGEVAQGAADAVRARTDNLAASVREQPLTAIVIAALAGMAVGIILRR